MGRADVRGWRAVSLAFGAEDLCETAVLHKDVRETTRGSEIIQCVTGAPEGGWVPTGDYEAAVASLKKFKAQMLKGASEQVREEIMAH